MILDDLGPRICIMGPSNSGKSTLAAAIGRARGLPVIHLDQLHHHPDSDWVPRPKAEFVALHDAALFDQSWVMDGNYTECLPQRLERATGLILLDLSVGTSLFRYIRRCLFERDRAGGLESKLESVKWEMIHHILIVTPPNRRRYRAMFDGLDLPRIRLADPRALAAFYAAEGLGR